MLRKFVWTLWLWLPLAHASFDFADFRSLLDKSKAGTVEEVLPLLPEEFKNNFVLVYESSSLQSASFELPRVIAFQGPAYLRLDSDKQLILAFQTNNGEASNKPQTIEIFEWQPESASYIPYDVEFLGKGKGYQLGRTQMCTHCHYTPIRPNWSAYPFWPGVYGSGFYPEDMVSNVEEATIRKREEEEFSKLKANWTHIPRLSLFNSKSMPEPLQHGATVSVNNLTSELGVQNRLRFTRMLKDFPEYSKFKYAMVAAFKGKDCGIEKFFLPDEFTRLRRGVFEFNQKLGYASQYLPTLESTTFENVNRNTKIWLSRSVIFSDEAETRVMTWMRFIFEGRGQGRLLQNMLGQLPMRRLTFSYDLTTVGARLAASVSTEFEKSEPELFKMSCEELAAKSLLAR